MARYIDADRIIFWIRHVSKDGLEDDVRRIAFKDEIERIPTADVVPKSEVERLKLEYENLVRNLFMELDIACTTDGHLVFCSYRRFAELKKKYTEEKT